MSSANPDLLRTLRLAIAHSWALRIGLALLGMHLAMAAFAPMLAPYSPTEMDPLHAFAAPSAEHLFGTDRYGRDLLSRVIFGGRVALAIALVAITTATLIGAILGLAIASLRGIVDDVLMRG